MTPTSPVQPQLPSLLREAPAVERERFRGAATLAQLPAGQQILSVHGEPTMMAFPVAGCVRVYLIGEEGREITLYRVEPGSSCVLSASCILGSTGFPALAEVEKDIVAWVVSAEVFRLWVAESPFWRSFVFRLLGERLATVLARLEETTFDRLDARLARLILEQGSDDIAVTHQHLANDLGSAREVVSRTLDRWRLKGWVETHRGGVTILDRAALVSLTR